MQETLNQAEEFVYSVCKRSFLSLWSYANPLGKGGKELCDILVVCEPDIIIFSVKNIRLTNSGDSEVDHARWRKHAIEASCKQIYGAERFIRTAPHVIRKDGSPGLPLATGSNWRIHRIAVAVGAQRRVPFDIGEIDKGFVHVFDEVTLGNILQELDTVTDFVTYLVDKESLCNSNIALIIQGAEEDLLALYLHNNRSFPQGPDMYVLDPDLWGQFILKDEYKRKKLADRDSYIWDKLIDEMAVGRGGPLEPGSSLSQDEQVLRSMARETRFCRRVLSKAYREFLIDARQKRTAARMCKSLSGTGYVFLHSLVRGSSEFRKRELYCRCFIARGKLEDCNTIVGISTEQWQATHGSFSYLMLLYMKYWTEQDIQRMRELQDALGYFKSPITKSVHENEYPEKLAK